MRHPIQEDRPVERTRRGRDARATLCSVLFGAMVIAPMMSFASGCEPSGDCEPGARGCACLVGSVCEGRAVCVDGLCSAADDLQLAVSGGGELRACEVVLRDGETRIVDVQFRPAVRGQFSRRGERTAIAFIASGDTKIDGAAVHVRAVDDAEGTGALRVDESECFDRNGRSVPSASVALR